MLIALANNTTYIWCSWLKILWLWMQIKQGMNPRPIMYCLWNFRQIVWPSWGSVTSCVKWREEIDSASDDYDKGLNETVPSRKHHPCLAHSQDAVNVSYSLLSLSLFISCAKYKNKVKQRITARWRLMIPLPRCSSILRGPYPHLTPKSPLWMKGTEGEDKLNPGLTCIFYIWL